MSIADEFITVADKLITVAENTPAVYEAGKTDEYMRFWNSYTNDRERTIYRYAFSEAGWVDEIFKPPYPIHPKDARYMFQNSGITSITENQVSFASCSAMRDVFINSSIISLRLKFGPNSSFFSTVFQGCENLENLTILETIKTNEFNVQWSTKLTHDSLMSILNALEDKSADTSGTVWTVTLGEINIAKLTDAEQEIANNKGWELG